MPKLFSAIMDYGPAPTNQLLYGDNLTIMRDMKKASIDLICIDPPFNSQRSYNLIYKQMTGLPVPEQEVAFCDAWELDAEKLEMARNMPFVLKDYGLDEGIVAFWRAWLSALQNTQPRLLAYLVYMSYRLLEMREILKPTGSLYLHCDPSASHYIKIFLDSVFGHQNFRNEIIWKRTNVHSDSRTWSRVHDVIFFYTKSDKFTWNVPHEPHSVAYLATKYRYKDETGRIYRLDNMTSPNPRPHLMYEWQGFPHPLRGWRYSKETMQKLHDDNRIGYPKKKDGTLDTSRRPQLKRFLSEMKGNVLGTVWTDINPINSQAKERLGYPTQKPVPLLKRIIEASSNEGDIVFDPFCGCGTTIYAAQETKRHWMGCDIAILSVRIVRDILLTRYGLKEGEHYQVSGVPLSVDGARDLFERDPRQFQHWSVELAGGFVNNRQSGDLGVDGRIYYETAKGLRNMVISVKGGHVAPAYIRELRGTLEREGGDTQLAGFICLTEPTKGMRQEVAAAGQFEYRGVYYDRLQIRSIADLLAGKAFDTPSRVQALNWQKQIPLPLTAIPKA